MMLRFKPLTLYSRRLLQSTPSASPTSVPKSLSVVNPIEEECTPGYNPKHFYPMRLYEVLNGRYQITTKLGWGTSSTVWLAKDLHQYVLHLFRRQALTDDNNNAGGAGYRTVMSPSKSMRTT